VIGGVSVVFLVVDDVCLKDAMIRRSKNIIDFCSPWRIANFKTSCGPNMFGVGVAGAEGVDEGQWGEVSVGISGEIG